MYVLLQPYLSSNSILLLVGMAFRASRSGNNIFSTRRSGYPARHEHDQAAGLLGDNNMDDVAHIKWHPDCVVFADARRGLHFQVLI